MPEKKNGAHGAIDHIDVRHSRESGNPGEDWIPGQARNDKLHKTYVVVYNYEEVRRTTWIFRIQRETFEASRTTSAGPFGVFLNVSALSLSSTRPNFVEASLHYPFVWCVRIFLVYVFGNRLYLPAKLSEARKLLFIVRLKLFCPSIALRFGQVVDRYPFFFEYLQSLSGSSVTMTLAIQSAARAGFLLQYLLDVWWHFFPHIKIDAISCRGRDAKKAVKYLQTLERKDHASMRALDGCVYCFLLQCLVVSKKT